MNILVLEINQYEYVFYEYVSRYLEKRKVEE